MRSAPLRILQSCGLVLLASLQAYAGPIALRGRQINTATMTRQADPATPLLEDGRQTWLIQVETLLTTEQRDALEAQGVSLVGYIPDKAYLVLADAAGLALMRQAAPVRWSGSYKPEYKRDPALPVSSLSTVDNGPSEQEVEISVLKPDFITRVADEVRALGGQVTNEEKSRRWGRVRARVTPDQIDTLSAMAEVEWIEPYRPPMLHNNVALSTNFINAPAAWTNGLLTGAGQIVAVADSGLDTGNTNTIHPDFTNRILAGFAYVTPGDWSDHNGHGTHVSGSVLGNGSGCSNGLFRGAAFEAQLVIQALGDTSGSGSIYLPRRLSRLFEDAYDEGARIHSDSWGAAANGAYDLNSRTVDEVIWDAKDLLVIFSAGNSGTDANSDGIVDPQSVGSPGTAKNCLTVGASESLRASTDGGYNSYKWGTGWPANYPAEPIKYDYLAIPDDGVHQGLAAFSSRGPCADGRIKPDIVAPGTSIISCRSRGVNAGTLWGTGTGLLANPAISALYTYSGGTSMSTPLTAGACALLRQYLSEQAGVANPSAALMKAAMLNGARSITPGQYGTGTYREIPATRPNAKEGWGQVDLGNTCYPDQGRTNIFLDSLSLDHTQTNRLLLVVNGHQNINITLAWSDYPASVPSDKQLVNDLDLHMITPAGSHLYAFGSNQADHTNNVETLDLTAPDTGVYTLEISGYQVPYGPQPYALAIKGNATLLQEGGLFSVWNDPSTVWNSTTVSVHAIVITNGFTVDAVEALYHVNGGTETTQQLSAGTAQSGLVEYSADLPLFSSGDVVTWQVRAVSTEPTQSLSQTNTFQVGSDLVYVAPQGVPTWPYTNWTQAFTNLTEAVDYIPEGGSIRVTNGLYSGPLDIAKQMSLTAMGSAVIVDGGGASACLNLLADARVDGLILRNGYALDGGGVLMSDGVLSNCRIEENTAIRYGGGVALVGGVVEHCLISSNHAGTYGGGIIIDAGLVQNCVIIDNIADSDGGGIELWGGTILHSTIAFNTSGGVGGGIDVGDPTATIANSIMVSNSASGGGANWFEWWPINCSYSCLSPRAPGTGNFDADPLFASPALRDLHLQSSAGRLAGTNWVPDIQNSPCIDMADPAAPFDLESEPTGERANLGAYGQTAQASRSDTSKVTLVVHSLYGQSDPAPGARNLERNTSQIFSITNTPLVSGQTRYEAQGWSLQGHSDTGGLNTAYAPQVGLVLTNNLLLDWTWTTGYYFQASAETHGSVSGTGSGWYSNGTPVSVAALADDYYQFLTWSGTYTSTNNPWSVPLTQPLQFTASFSALLAAQDVPVWWLAAYGFTTNFDLAALEDSDQDGAATWMEYQAGTDPTNSSSVLRLTPVLSSDSNANLNWYGRQGYTYTLFWGTNLNKGVTNLLQTLTPTEDGMVSIQDASHTDPTAVYYRLNVTHP